MAWSGPHKYYTSAKSMLGTAFYLVFSNRQWWIKKYINIEAWKDGGRGGVVMHAFYASLIVSKQV